MIDIANRKKKSIKKQYVFCVMFFLLDRRNALGIRPPFGSGYTLKNKKMDFPVIHPDLQSFDALAY